MKNIFLLSFCLTFLISCSKDYTNPENLNGTEWRSYDIDENYEYFLLKFISTSQAELWVKWVNPLDDYPNPEYIYSGEYSIDGNSIEIIPSESMGYSGTFFKGIIESKEIELKTYNDGVHKNTLKFVKD